MKTILKTIVASAVLAGFASLPVSATTQNCNDAGVMYPYYHHQYQSDSWVTTTGTTSISSSGAISTATSGGGGCSITYNGSTVLSWSVSNVYPYNSASASATNQPAGDYHVSYGVNAGDYETWNFQTSFTW